MKTRFYLLLTAVVMHFAACTPQSSESVDQATIFTGYELFYDANQDKTYAYAQFRFGNVLGTVLQLSKPSTVSFNNDELVFDPLTNFYFKEYKGLVSSGNFTWKDINSKTYVNPVVIKDTIKFPAIQTIPRNDSYELKWIGNPLSQNEYAGLVIAAPYGQNPQLASSNTVNSTSIIISRNQLQALNSSTADIIMDRIFQPPIQQATPAGGQLSGKYRTRNVSVTLN